VLLPIALLPAILLLFPRVPAMLAVAALSVPCCIAAPVYADVAQNLPGLPDRLLYDDSRFMLLIGAYALARSIHLAINKRRSGDNKT